MKIIIVEDDVSLCSGIAISLGEYETVTAHTLKEAKSVLDDTADLMLLDINLPDGNGVDFCREIRHSYSVPIIFLTANNMEIDIVGALESGGDDYITKPFSLAVLRARVNAVLRRRESSAVTVFEYKDYRFDFENMRFTKNGRQIELSKTEQRLLKLFTDNCGQTLTRDTLISRIWDDIEFVEENALSVTVNRLRGKLKEAPIKTVYGIGYVWEKDL